MPFPKQMILGRGWEAEGMKSRDCNNQQFTILDFGWGWGKGKEDFVPFCHLRELLRAQLVCSLLPHLGSVARGSPGCGEGSPAVCSAGDLFALPTASSLIA